MWQTQRTRSPISHPRARVRKAQSVEMEVCHRPAHSIVSKYSSLPCGFLRGPFRYIPSYKNVTCLCPDSFQKAVRQLKKAPSMSQRVQTERVRKTRAGRDIESGTRFVQNHGLGCTLAAAPELPSSQREKGMWQCPYDRECSMAQHPIAKASGTVAPGTGPRGAVP